MKFGRYRVSSDLDTAYRGFHGVGQAKYVQAKYVSKQNILVSYLRQVTTITEHIIVAGAENRPPMLEKIMYDSWASRIRLFIKRKKHDRIMLDSINNGPLVYPTVEENRQTRPMKYFKLTKAQQLQDDCDVQATNIILYDLPPNVYALVNHQEGETLYEYYRRFSQLINDMHTIGMTMQQVQVNSKFLNALPSDWSKFVTGVKLAKSLYTTNYDQLYSYLSQHERHANETEDLDAYDSNCDDISSAKAVLMTNPLSCDPEVLSK
nr:hypothetical protein [Tanacetum cinerariifolium]